ncbi:hypothetical protein HDU67_006842 [Dinochytrium kinnereticum]|nr:hypothetical protein HDU67_006842 [Dinochytrium kinnereticum]
MIKNILLSAIDAHLADLDDVRLVSSHHLSPEAIRTYRATVLVCITAYTGVNFAVDRDGEYAKYFAYFTNFSWLGLVFYFALATYNVHVYIKSGYSADRLKKRNPFLRWLFWNAYIVPVVFHYVIPTVFWVLLVESVLRKPTLYNWIDNLIVHGLTAVFMTVEIILSRVPMHYSQWTTPIGIATLFVLYSQLAHIWFSTPDKSFWAYPFLDTSSKLWYVWYLGVGVLFFLFFTVVTAVHRARDRRRERLQLRVVAGRRMSAAVGALAVVGGADLEGGSKD